MNRKAYIFFVLLLAFQIFKGQKHASFSSACTLTISSAPASSSTTCNGSITSVSAGTVCAPISYTVTPGGSFINLCTGTYTVTYQDAGCCGISTGTVYVGDITAISEKEKAEEIFFFYTAETLHFNNIKEIYTINIVNSVGQNIKSILLQPGTKSVPLDSLPDGIYWIVMLRNGERVKSTKIYSHQ